jgi:hypothetical protein
VRAVVNQKMRVFHGHVPVDLDKGQEVTGSLAAMLLKQAPRKVTRLDADPEPEVPNELDIEGTATEVLAWVSNDPERAAEALAAEVERDKPRSTLVKTLKKLADEGDE